MNFKTLFSYFSNNNAKIRFLEFGLVFVFIGLFMAVSIFYKDEKRYVVLFDALKADDVIKVIKELEKDGIEYKLNSDCTIKVPQNIDLFIKKPTTEGRT